MSAEEATVNPDGSATFEEPPAPAEGAGEPTFDEPPPMDEETMNEKAEEIVQGIDPAIYLLVAVAILGALYYFFVYRKKQDESDSFFAELDGEKVSQTRRAAKAVSHQVQNVDFRCCTHASFYFFPQPSLI